MQEIELKFFDVNPAAIDTKLRALGAKKEYESELSAIYFCHPVLPIDIFDMHKQTLRLRTENGKHVLTYKTKTMAGQMKMQQEHEVVVTDKDEMLNILAGMGFTHTKPVAKQRTHYALGDVHFEIDQYHGEKPYLEIETQSEQKMHSICEQLGLRLEDGSNKNVIQLYPHLWKLDV